MAIFTPTERATVRAMSELAFCNPFEARRIELERAMLGDAFEGPASAWSLQPDSRDERANIQRMLDRLEPIVDSATRKLHEGVTASREDLAGYEDAVLYTLYHRYRHQLHQLDAGKRVPFWRAFAEQFDRRLKPPGVTMPGGYDAAHVLGCFYQVRRAFSQLFEGIVGSSPPAANLRAAAWQSIFTHDMRRYFRAMYARMSDFTTLITGESGTGKEIVAQAIGRSRYIPFNPVTEKFARQPDEVFFPLNLSALSPTLIESELFGHRRGAFTGAVMDRAGWLEQCPPMGAVFLDEIGELDPAVAVKLLRVLQTRRFQRLGETEDRTFHGKIIAATNRDLEAMMLAGDFRKDFYYRLCSDVVRTPALREQLSGRPEELTPLARFIVGRLLGEDDESTTAQVVSWIRANLGDDYAWPGNIRELEQCVRNLLIRGSYGPPHAEPADDAAALAADMRAVAITADEALARYCRIAHQRLGGYVQAARALALDRRTVRAKLHANPADA